LRDAEDEDDGDEDSCMRHAAEDETEPGDQCLGQRGDHDPEGYRPHCLRGKASDVLAALARESAEKT
jgi:hypothetical protein